MRSLERYLPEKARRGMRNALVDGTNVSFVFMRAPYHWVERGVEFRVRQKYGYF